MSINLNRMVQGALTESVLQHIAGRIGRAPESAQRVVSLCGPALIGALMNKASSLEGARNLFAAIMPPATNAMIAEELPHFVVREEGFKTLVDNGATVDHAVASHDSLEVLAARIGESTGSRRVPRGRSQASSAQPCSACSSAICRSTTAVRTSFRRCSAISCRWCAPT